MRPEYVTSPYLVPLYNEIVVHGTQDAGGAAWPAANRALYRPLHPDVTLRNCTICFWVTTGAPANNYDIGIYAEDWTTRLKSAGSSGLATGKNSWASGFTFEAGQSYMLALVLSGTNSILRQTPSLNSLRGGGYAEEASAIPLPATATPVTPTSTYIPLITIESDG